MNILVCVKQVPDTTEVKLSSSLTLQRDFVAQVINPADESALELGLQLRETHGGKVTVLTMGPARAETMLREMLSRGADEAVHLCDNAFAGSDTLVTAKNLALAIQHLGGFDLILCGKRATDGETGQVGGMLASLLDIACIPNVTAANVEGHQLSASQLTEDGTVTWNAPLPAVLTLCEWSHRLRLPTILGLRKAHTADIQRLTAKDIGAAESGLRASPTQVVRIDSRPVGVRPCQKLSYEEAMQALRQKEVLP